MPNDRTALDIAADLVNALSHTHGDDFSDFGEPATEQWAQYAREFLLHPEGKAADQRNRMRFWKFIEQASQSVDRWPAWKRGEPRNAR